MTHPSQLEKRVNSILDRRTNRSTMARPAAVLVLGTTAAMTVFLGAARLTALPAPPQAVLAAIPAPPAAEVPSESSKAPVKPSLAAQSEQSPLSPNLHKWLDEDVAYIITTEEKQAFLRQPTDAERERFIEQFWLRRDPTPGTPQNELKEENYRRIAYANERFSYGNVAGWQSDRGHIYILYGKPDEIESHPSGGNYSRPAEAGGGTVNTYPFEVWTYRYIEGIGNNVRLEFVDRNGTGEYQLTMDPNGKSIIGTPSASSIPIEVSSQLSPKAGVTDVTTTIKIPYSALACSGDSVSRTCNVKVTGAIWRADTRVLAFDFGRMEKVRIEQFNDVTQRMVFEKQISLSTGVYTLELTVQDLNSGLTGKTTQPLFIP
jgi:GWxTD domain-containing protein